MTDGTPALRVHVGEEVWRLDHGRVLVGGAPLRVLRLGGAEVPAVFAATDAATSRRVRHLLDAGLAHPDPADLPSIPLDELTVIVPVFGRAESLDRLLRGLTGVRVIVVDDG
ncbi:MAG: glycosyltransferase, partial [Actinobacteria bacterium]|nr:glycosyltransferase [Actinomycetota bacterium]